MALTLHKTTKRYNPLLKITAYFILDNKINSYKWLRRFNFTKIKNIAITGIYWDVASFLTRNATIQSLGKPLLLLYTLIYSDKSTFPHDLLRRHGVQEHWEKYKADLKVSFSWHKQIVMDHTITWFDNVLCINKEIQKIYKGNIVDTSLETFFTWPTNAINESIKPHANIINCIKWIANRCHKIIKKCSLYYNFVKCLITYQYKDMRWH